MRQMFTKVPVQEYERLVRKARVFDYLKTVVLKERVRVQGEPAEDEILKWTKEARKLARQGKLPVLRSLKDLQ
ncbi:MAG: hypothetical protein HY001_00290 [Candidatus Portnoybacteria bacterium]|nr:hypothetical protein [Candidatus Portnoybacteria bacterium]